VTDGLPQLDVAALRTTGLEPPFNIPDARRIKNAVFGPAEVEGILVTFFRNPDPGETQWKVTREFLKY
jgi:hypothetical protein